MSGASRTRSSDAFQTTQTITATGFVGIPPNNNNASSNFPGFWGVKGEGKIRVDTTGADPGVSVDIEVRIGSSPTWTVLATHTGDLIEEYKILSWDFLRFKITSFAGSEFTFRSAGYFLIDADVDTSLLNLEGTQLQVLEKICELLGQSENSWFEYNQTVAETGVDKTVFTSSAVPVAKNRWVNKVDVTCNREGKFTILKGVSIIGSGRTSLGDKNGVFIWMPAHKLVAGEDVVVKFKQFSGTSSDVEIYAHGIEK